jgi:hypothetical protein
MGTDATAREDDRSAREEILTMLKDGMDDLSTDIAAAEPATTEDENLQLRRYHELGYLANQYRKLKRDTELDEMGDRLALLEEEVDQ